MAAFGEAYVVDPLGNVQAGVAVDLIDPATGVRILDTVYRDAALSQIATLPLTTDPNGHAPFWLAAGKTVIGRVSLGGAVYDDYINVVDPTAPVSGGGSVPSHTHVEADVSPLVADLAAKAPLSHTHTEAQVTSLTFDLASKALGTHSHVETDVSNLTTDLAATEKTANKGIANGYMGLDNTNLALAARLATGTPDATTYLRGDRVWQTRPVTVYGASLHNPAGIAAGTYILNRVPASRAGTAVKIQGIATGGTSVPINFQKNAGTNYLAASLTVVSGATWTATTTLQNTATAADDSIALVVGTPTGTVTDLTVQLEVQ